MTISVEQVNNVLSHLGQDLISTLDQNEFASLIVQRLQSRLITEISAFNYPSAYTTVTVQQDLANRTEIPNLQDEKLFTIPEKIIRVSQIYEISPSGESYRIETIGRFRQYRRFIICDTSFDRIQIVGTDRTVSPEDLGQLFYEALSYFVAADISPRIVQSAFQTLQANLYSQYRTMLESARLESQRFEKGTPYVYNKRSYNNGYI